MPYLINPAGRMVAIQDKDFEVWKKTPGFTLPTKEQEVDFIKERTKQFERSTFNENKERGVYIVTVSQGGKDGYSIASGALIRELNKLDIPCSTAYGKQKIGLLFHAPFSITRMETPVRMIYTMFESDKIPDEWIDYLNAADVVVVPSKWCQSVFVKAGIQSRVIPLGYDDEIFKYVPRTNKRKAGKPFTFLHYNAFNIRKGFLEVFKAFTQEFDKAEPVKLIFKTTLEQIPLPITQSEYPNIEIIRGKTSESELFEIIKRSDCFLFPSRGEGFGLTPLETMATGIPAIVPNAHGISEYFDPEYMFEVKVKETCPGIYARYKNQDVGNMVVCDVDDLRSRMRWAYEHQDETLALGMKAAEYVRKYTIQESAKKWKTLFDEFMLKPVTEKSIKNVLTLEKIT